MVTEVKDMQNNSSFKNYQDIQTIKTMYEKAFDGGVQQAKDYIIKISKKLGNK